MQINKNILKCPICFQEIEKCRNIAIHFNEFNEFNCENCHNFHFLFILCEYCHKMIYYKKNDSIDNNNNDRIPKLNGMNGINIKCPYPSCGKYFYLTICPKCQQKQKIPKIIYEGDLIKCNNELKRCGYEYLQVRCTRKYCNDITYFARPKNYCNSPNGIIYNHKKQLIFQKISCYYCIRPIVYNSYENKVNRYYDSMEIICPYQGCGKCFNRIVCPFCSKINIIEGGYYIMGHKIKCIECNKYFGKILCSKCLKINPLTKNFFKSGTILCSYTSCNKKSEIINCIFCRKMNIFNKLPTPGQQIKCGYKKCNNIFNEVYCPSCNELNPFQGDFLFGKVYICIYSFCQKPFQYLICGNCSSYSITTETHEGKTYICNNPKCNSLLSNWGCPFCKKTIISKMDKNNSFNLGDIIECPNCKKQYSFCRCYTCHKLIFSKENESILGLSVTCESCQQISVNIVCPNCTTKISFLERNNNLDEGEKIKCGKCNKEFEYKRKSSIENEIYSKNLSILESVEGEPINFGKSSVDESYLSIEKLFIKSNLYYDDEQNIDNLIINKEIINKNEYSKKKNINNLCILCHCNTKESVFFPCGHRCTCYLCAVLFFHTKKECPKCRESALAIIPKIYEQFSKKETNI